MELDTPNVTQKPNKDADSMYMPHKALRCAVRDWIPEFYRHHLSDSDQYTEAGGKGDKREEEEEEEDKEVKKMDCISVICCSCLL